MNYIAKFYGNVDPNVLGPLPLWAAGESGETMKDSLINSYPYYMGEMTGGELSDDGQYLYPGDPPLSPLCKLERVSFDDVLKEVCYIYEYAIVACKNMETGAVWVTRMD